MFVRKCTLYGACNDRKAASIFTSSDQRRHKLGHGRMQVMPYHISWTIFTLALGTNCAPHVANLL